MNKSSKLRRTKSKSLIINSQSPNPIIKTEDGGDKKEKEGYMKKVSNLFKPQINKNSLQDAINEGKFKIKKHFDKIITK